MTPAERVSRALVAFLGFDPTTHEVHTIRRPFRGVLVMTGGRSVRFVTDKALAKMLKPRPAQIRMQVLFDEVGGIVLETVEAHE